MGDDEKKSQERPLAEELWGFVGEIARELGAPLPQKFEPSDLDTYRGAPVVIQGRPVLQFKESQLEVAVDVFSFSQQHGLFQYLQRACNLIESCFSSVEELSIKLAEDPESGEKWIVLDITMQGEVEEVLDQYQNYTRQLVSHVPWPERNKIRLSYNII